MDMGKSMRVFVFILFQQQQQQQEEEQHQHHHQNVNLFQLNISTTYMEFVPSSKSIHERDTHIECFNKIRIKTEQASKTLNVSAQLRVKNEGKWRQ